MYLACNTITLQERLRRKAHPALPRFLPGQVFARAGLGNLPIWAIRRVSLHHQVFQLGIGGDCSSWLATVLRESCQNA